MGETHSGFVRTQITEWRWGIFSYYRYRLMSRKGLDSALTLWVLGLGIFSVGFHVSTKRVNYIAEKKVLGTGV